MCGALIAFSGESKEKNSGIRKGDHPTQLAGPVTPALTLVYLTTPPTSKFTRPFFDPEIKDLGSQGAALGIDDNSPFEAFI